jgi:hypothetical protein
MMKLPENTGRYLDPFEDGIDEAEKSTRSISVFLLVSVFFHLAESWAVLQSFYGGGEPFYPVDLLFLMPRLFFYIGVALFVLRKKTGWYIVTVYLACNILERLTLLGFNLFSSSSSDQSPPLLYSWLLLFFMSLIWMICKKPVRSVFHVHSAGAWLAVVAGIAFTLISAVLQFA